MSTEEIARKVKEYLQLSKIGQRTFAEGLLSMRQANFSSLLSHPMPWSELSKTYRDRFLIMYHWLNDPDRLSKLTSMPSARKNIPNGKQLEIFNSIFRIFKFYFLSISQFKQVLAV